MCVAQSVMTRMRLAIWLVFVHLLLTACSGGEETPETVEPTPSPSQSAPAAPVISPEVANQTETPAAGSTGEDVYPVPGGAPAVDSYPGIGVETDNASPYPAPESPTPQPTGAPADTVTPLSPTIALPTTAAPPTEPALEADDTYPGPEGTPAQTPLVTGTLLAPPPPAGSPVGTTTTQPGLTPGAPTSGPSLTGTPLPPTAATVTTTLTPTPSLTPTLSEPDPKFHPTDPKTVKLASGKVQLVEFFAYWCGSCRALAPVIHRLEDRYGRRMNFIYLDTDNPETKDLKRELGFRSEPQIFLLDEQGKILRIWGSGVTAATLDDAIRSALD